MASRARIASSGVGRSATPLDLGAAQRAGVDRAAVDLDRRVAGGDRLLELARSAGVAVSSGLTALGDAVPVAPAPPSVGPPGPVLMPPPPPEPVAPPPLLDDLPPPSCARWIWLRQSLYSSRSAGRLASACA